MEETNSEEDVKNNNGICKHVETMQEWSDNVTVLSLSSKNLTHFDVKLPPNLTALDLSQNKLQAVPECVLNHNNIRALILSSNDIKYFDDTPKFLHCIVRLEINNNNLHGPPYWIWAEKPENLTYLDISDNEHLTKALKEFEYYDEISQCKTKLTHIKLFNCKIGVYSKLYATFPEAKQLEIGATECNFIRKNFVDIIPGSLEHCCQVEMLNVCNTKVFSVKNNIHLLTNLREINLSFNSLTSLPNNFCALINLEICVLSFNSLIYLPDCMGKMTKLVYLSLDNNHLCMLPESLTELPQLVMLDVYNNSIYEVPDKLLKELPQIDVAKNFLDEPESSEYAQKKIKLRLNVEEKNRCDGRKYESEPTSNQSSCHSDVDEEYENYCNTGYDHTEDDAAAAAVATHPSSDSDWDSDECWVPTPAFRGCPRGPPPAAQSAWLYYVKDKMAEGNFCPMDLHTVSITERVEYDKLCNPRAVYESDGQFDDLSEGDS